MGTCDANCRRYKQLNLQSSIKYRRYAGIIASFLHDRPREFVRHVMTRYLEGAHFCQEDIVLIDTGAFEVMSSKHDGSSYMVYFDLDGIPSCDCYDWCRHHLPCKHFCAIFQLFGNNGYGWEAMAQTYRDSPFFSLDDTVVGSRSLQVNSVNCQGQLAESPTDADSAARSVHSLHIESSECKASSCRELLIAMTNLTYIVEDDLVITQFHDELQRCYDKLTILVPTDCGLLELPKTKKRKKKVQRSVAEATDKLQSIQAKLRTLCPTSGGLPLDVEPATRRKRPAENAKLCGKEPRSSTKYLKELPPRKKMRLLKSRAKGSNSLGQLVNEPSLLQQVNRSPAQLVSEPPLLQQANKSQAKGSKSPAQLVSEPSLQQQANVSPAQLVSEPSLLQQANRSQAKGSKSPAQLISEPSLLQQANKSPAQIVSDVSECEPSPVQPANKSPAQLVTPQKSVLQRRKSPFRKKGVTFARPLVTVKTFFPPVTVAPTTSNSSRPTSRQCVTYADLVPASSSQLMPITKSVITDCLKQQAGARQMTCGSFSLKDVDVSSLLPNKWITDNVRNLLQVLPLAFFIFILFLCYGKVTLTRN